MSECQHGDDAATCPPCQGAGRPRAQAARSLLGVSFTASYAGRCASCEHAIEVGDAIRVVADLEGGGPAGYVHDDPMCMDAIR